MGPNTTSLWVNIVLYRLAITFIKNDQRIVSEPFSIVAAFLIWEPAMAQCNFIL